MELSHKFISIMDGSLNLAMLPNLFLGLLFKSFPAYVDIAETVFLFTQCLHLLQYSK